MHEQYYRVQLQSYFDFMNMKLKMQLKTELSRSVMLRLTMKELVTFHMRR